MKIRTLDTGCGSIGPGISNDIGSCLKKLLVVGLWHSFLAQNFEADLMVLSIRRGIICICVQGGLKTYS